MDGGHAHVPGQALAGAGGGEDVRVAGKRRCHLPTDSARRPTNLHSRNPMIIP